MPGLGSSTSHQTQRLGICLHARLIWWWMWWTQVLRSQSFSRIRPARPGSIRIAGNRSLELVFGHPRRFPVSFVTHHMLFNADLVKELLHLIEKRFGRPWWEAILKEVDQGHAISFSEYELYGHFVLSQPYCWEKRVCFEYWHGFLITVQKISRDGDCPANDGRTFEHRVLPLAHAINAFSASDSMNLATGQHHHGDAEPAAVFGSMLGADAGGITSGSSHHCV